MKAFSSKTASGWACAASALLICPAAISQFSTKTAPFGWSYNGEIYNFPELRKELEGRGHHFYTNTDTEVIVHLYEDMGADCVQKLRGMFAFALYDERNRRLLLARDRLGKKPLHYALSNGRLLFGSEIKTILTVAPELAKVDQGALLQYFYFGYVPDPATAFTPIQKLPPGHVLEFEGGKIKVSKYWDLPEYGTYSPASEEECLEELEHRLAEAVRIRLIADVPLGAMLSGGTDSSTVVALMARASSQPVKTFSIGFRHADFDEAPYARMVAEKFGTEHHELILEPNVVGDRGDDHTFAGRTVWRFFHAADLLHFLSGAKTRDRGFVWRWRR